MKPVALLLSSLLAATFAVSASAEEAKAAAKPDLAKGQATSTAVCGACHTADGSRGSPANPILQGQHPEYLAKHNRSCAVSRMALTTKRALLTML